MPSLILIRSTQLLLTLTFTIGVYATWYLISYNGTAELMRDVRIRGPHIVPGTKAPLKRVFTGIGTLDHQLTVLTLFFWEVVDGSMPNASLFCFGFAGQAVAAWTVIYIEGRRASNRWRIISFVMCWGLAMQMGTIAVFLPLYLVIHLSTSPTVRSSKAKDHIVDIPNILSIPISLTIGFGLLAILLSLPAPSVLTFDQKQAFIAAWQAFPVWVELLQQSLSWVIAQMPGYMHWMAPTPSRGTSPRTMGALRLVYVFVLGVAGVTRITVIMLSLTSKLFPEIFAPGYRGMFDPSNVFVPKSFLPSTKMSSIGAGAFQLLQYDEMVGSTALAIWSIALYANTYKQTANIDSIVVSKMLLAFVTSWVLFGGCGCAVCFAWARDEIIFATDHPDERKSK